MRFQNSVQPNNSFSCCKKWKRARRHISCYDQLFSRCLWPLYSLLCCCLYIFLVFLFFAHICVVLLSYLCCSFVIFMFIFCHICVLLSLSFFECLWPLSSLLVLSKTRANGRQTRTLSNIFSHFFLNMATWYSHVKFSSDQMIFSSACVSKTDMATMSYILSLGPHNHIQIIFSTCFFRTGFSWYKDWHENHLTFLSLRACNIFISQIHWQTFLLKKKGDPGSILYYILCNCAVFQMVWVVSTLCWANTSSNSID